MTGRTRTRLLTVSLAGWLCLPLAPARAEDGYELWLRYPPQEPAPAASAVSAIVAPGEASATVEAAIGELQRGLGGLLGAKPPTADAPTANAVVLATPANRPGLATLGLPLDGLGAEGYLVRRVELDGVPVTLLAANTDRGLLYGAFALLRHLQTGGELERIDLASAPRVQLRLLNHWDNLDRYVERGYAGQSLWDWWRLPDVIDPRYTDYARANASIGINGTVLNNVNAAAAALTPRYIEKAAALADVLRPWGVRVYLSARFSAPVDIGGLETADPLDPAVRQWWSARVNEIYARIPDFGGFLVKANSEGQPGPQNYGRSHADGANMLAAALRPHGGIVMWRAFVYSDTDPEDRVKQAYSEFKPLDGDFADNVLVQVKNGPLDFQPREPFHPLFGAMPQTPLLMEFQITQEYLGFSTHLVYLGTLWEEVLQSDTFADGPGSTVARVVDGSLHDQALTGIAGVANTGTDRNWSGSIFGQANWYAFGRLAWNPHASAAAIAEEWLRMTFSDDARFVDGALDIMLRSREAAVDYMTPLGLTHIMGTGHHYGPAPWVDDLGRPEWNPFYYHRAGPEGIGFDRTRSGSDALAQYAPEYAKPLYDPATTPDEYLLWYHRLPWDYRLPSGRTLWEELVRRYDHGVAEAERMRRDWAGLKDFIDAERHEQVARYLAIQVREARWWRNACLAYFKERSGRPWPEGVEPPPHTLEYYRSLRFPYAPGDGR